MSKGYPYRRRGASGIYAGLALAVLAACAVTVKEPAPPAPAPVTPLSSLSSGTAKEPEPANPPQLPAAAVPPAPPVRVPVYRETGIAGWYGKELQGEKTAPGDVFDMNDFSAAHRTLPLGTIIRVTNLENSKSIDVKIVHRGPFVKNRVLDLSYGAARELGFLANGTTRVKIEAREALRGAARYTIEAAVYTEEENARLLKDRLSRKFELVYIVQTETAISRLYHVRIGSYASEKRAGQIAGKLALEGLEPVVLRKD